MEGGNKMAMGYWSAVQMMFGSKTGRNINAGFLDFKIPSALDVPNIKSVIVEVPAKDTLYGARGVGEPPIVATATAIANAVADAIGAHVTALPLTPERVRAAVRQKRG